MKRFALVSLLLFYTFTHASAARTTGTTGGLRLPSPIPDCATQMIPPEEPPGSAFYDGITGEK